MTSWKLSYQQKELLDRMDCGKWVARPAFVCLPWWLPPSRGCPSLHGRARLSGLAAPPPGARSLLPLPACPAPGADGTSPPAFEPSPRRRYIDFPWKDWGNPEEGGAGKPSLLL
jgi:hypothetical protein